MGVAWSAPLAGPPRGYSEVEAMLIGYLRLYVWVRFSVRAPWLYPHDIRDRVSIPSSVNEYPCPGSGSIVAWSEQYLRRTEQLCNSEA